MHDANNETLRCVILPLTNNWSLLLPASALIEVMESKSMDVVVDLQKGILGKVQWRNIAVSLIAFEVASGLADPSFKSETRIAVIYSASDDPDLAYVAFTVQDTPKYTDLTAEQIHLLDSDNVSTESPLADMQVKVEGNIAWIPNMSKIEEYIQKLILR